MLQPHSNDPNVAEAAEQALRIIQTTLNGLELAKTYDYGGHLLQIGEYDVCKICTSPIAEAQQAQQALEKAAEAVTDETVREHVTLAAEFFRLEAEAAVVRAELHNGSGTEPIVNTLLGYQFERGIHDDYHHSHQSGVA